MSTAETAKEKAKELTGGDGKQSLARRILVPLGASAASAVTAYAARKAAPFLREKLEGLTQGAAGSRGTGAITKAKDQVGETVSAVVSNVSGSGGSDDQEGGSGQSSGAAARRPAQKLTPREREEKQKRRAEAREARKHALKG